MENLTIMKREMIEWAKEKKIRDEYDLNRIGKELDSLENSEVDGYETEEKRERIKNLELGRMKFFNGIEEQRRLKSTEIWILVGDENSKLCKRKEKYKYYLGIE